MFFQLFGFLFLLFGQSLGQTLAKEPTSPDNPTMPSNGSPTEEDLIQKLLKSPGLPPAMPPSLEEEPKMVEQPPSKGNTEEPSKEPKGIYFTIFPLLIVMGLILFFRCHSKVAIIRKGAYIKRGRHLFFNCF
jgi:hypothetical protein